MRVMPQAELGLNNLVVSDISLVIEDIQLLTCVAWMVDFVSHCT